jgi:hypothetical protein
MGVNFWNAMQTAISTELAPISSLSVTRYAAFNAYEGAIGCPVGGDDGDD